MSNTPKQTPLTVENFKELLVPEINKQFDIVFKEIKAVRSDLTGEIKSVRSDLTGEIKSVQSDLTKLAHTVNDLKETVEETNEKVNFLPTTEVFLKSQDELMGELKKSRETTEFTGQHYTVTNDRIDRIDKFIGFDSNLN